MDTAPFDGVSGITIALVFLPLLLGGIETGFRIGRKSQSTFTRVTQSHASAIAATLLGVLGLLLGFTISMAVSRYERRTQLVQDEAKAIGTAYLRTHLLPSPDGAPIAALLTDYVDNRLRYAAISHDLKDIQAAREEGMRLQHDFWTKAVTYAKQDRNMVTAGLLVQTLNEAIDLEGERWMGFNNHVPVTVIYLNGLVALLAVNMVGYSVGLEGRRQLYSTCMLALAITVVMVVAIDLDSPRQGLVRVSQRPMIELQHELAGAPRP